MDAATPTEASMFPTLPPNVAAAVSKVMQGVEKLDKEESNKFANYKYAGIESYLEMVRPLCAAAGLIILQEEEGYELVTTQDKKGESIAWLVMRFAFGLAHSSGETWTGVIHRTGMVQANMGSQAFGAAQSYALKSFLRSLGLIATGDTEDADSHAQRDLPSSGVSELARGNRRTLGKKDSRAIYDQLQEEIRAITDKDALRKHYLENRPRINQMHIDYQKWIIDEYENRQTAIDVGADEEGRTIGETIGDEIPQEGGGEAA